MPAKAKTEHRAEKGGMLKEKAFLYLLNIIMGSLVPVTIQPFADP